MQALSSIRSISLTSLVLLPLLSCASDPPSPIAFEDGADMYDSDVALRSAEAQNRFDREDRARSYREETRFSGRSGQSGQSGQSGRSEQSGSSPEWNTGFPEEDREERIPARWDARAQFRSGEVMMDDSPGSAHCSTDDINPQCLFDYEIEALREGRSTPSLDRMRANGFRPHLGDLARSEGREGREDRGSRADSGFSPVPEVGDPGPDSGEEAFQRVPRKGDTWWGYGSELALTYEQMASWNGLNVREVAQGKRLVVGVPVRLSRAFAGRDAAFRKQVVQHNTALSHHHDGDRVRTALEGLRSGKSLEDSWPVPAVRETRSSGVAKASGKPQTSRATGPTGAAGTAQKPVLTQGEPVQRVVGSRGKRFDRVAARFGFNTYLQLRRIEVLNERRSGSDFMDFESGKLLKDLLIPAEARQR